jgi:hypothetical protein
MDNYYLVKFANISGFYVWATSAVEAIAEARAVIRNETRVYASLGRVFDAPLGAALVRRATYGEWDCDSKHITIDGNHHH